MSPLQATHTNETLQSAAIERHLNTTRFGRRLHLFDELDSTNTTARELADGGAEEGTAVIAESQRRGRGRLGRSWASPPHRNLYLSLVLRPSQPTATVPQLTLVAGLAAAEAVHQWSSTPRIKWPNDLVSGGRKLAGILTEMVADETDVRFVIAGIGVNLNSGVDDFPPELRSIATSLRLITGAPIDRARFTAELLNRFEARYDQWQRDGFVTLAPAWEALSSLTGEEIVVQSQERGGDERRAGIVLGIADDGTLRIRASDGREHHIVAGEVTVVKADRSA